MIGSRRLVVAIYRIIFIFSFFIVTRVVLSQFSNITGSVVLRRHWGTCLSNIHGSIRRNTSYSSSTVLLRNKVVKVVAQSTGLTGHLDKHLGQNEVGVVGNNPGRLRDRNTAGVDPSESRPC